MGLLNGLQMSFQNGIRRLKIEGNSNLVISQMNDDCEVKSEKLVPLYELACSLRNKFMYTEFQFISNF